MNGGQCPIERGQFALVTAGEGYKVSVRYMGVTHDSGVGQFEKRHGVRPELVPGQRGDLPKKLLCAGDSEPGPQHEPQQSALGNRTSGEKPSAAGKPRCRPLMRGMVDIGKRDQDVRVQKETHR